MSRSYRKPYFACGLGGGARKFFKRYSNKMIRVLKARFQMDGNSLPMGPTATIFVMLSSIVGKRKLIENC